jgi:hypothetical protein
MDDEIKAPGRRRWGLIHTPYPADRGSVASMSSKWARKLLAPDRRVLGDGVGVAVAPGFPDRGEGRTRHTRGVDDRVVDP